MKTRIKNIFLSILVLLVLTAIVPGFFALRKQIVLKERMKDIQALGNSYHQQSIEATNISILLKDLAAKGIKLNNPLSKNVALSCYEIVHGFTNANGTVLIQETTNVADKKYIVRLYDSGAVTVERR